MLGGFASAVSLLVIVVMMAAGPVECNRPEWATPYRLAQYQAASFIAHIESGSGGWWLRSTKDGIDAFLEGGFLMPRFGKCDRDKLLACSCMRGVCRPSFGARCHRPKPIWWRDDIHRLARFL